MLHEIIHWLIENNEINLIEADRMMIARGKEFKKMVRCWSKGAKFSKEYSYWDLMSTIVAIVNNTVVYTWTMPRVDLKFFHHTQEYGNYMVRDF